MCDHIGCRCHIFSMDSPTPLNLHLSAYFKRSFAFYTVKERLPIILTKIVDHLVREKEAIYKSFGDHTKDDLKAVIGELSKLKYELQTNKPLEYFNSNIPDTKVYDWYIKERSKCDGEPKYFTTIWLLVECYMYRRIRFIFENTETLMKYDPFRWQKKDAFNSSYDAIVSLIDHLIPFLKPDVDINRCLIELLKLNLWGNKCDLSISAGASNSQLLSPSEIISSNEDMLLCDHTDQIWNCLVDEDNVSHVVEIINDNAGFEMCTDFCVADFLVTHKLAQNVIFNLKTIPWYVSDTTIYDQRWIIRHLINNENAHLKKIGIRWNKYIREKIWIIEDDPFWTYPLDYTYMESKAPELYNRLKEAKLVIFKGDLNYRKLFGERNWEPTTPINVAIQGFEPTNCCILRTLKADIICGLEKGIAEKLDETDPDWRFSGKYGVIQFSEKDNMEQ